MRWFFQYIRQCLCKHEFENEKYKYANTEMFGILAKEHTYVSMFCPKCGFNLKKKIK